MGSIIVYGNTLEAYDAVAQLEALDVKPGAVRHILPPGPQGGMVSVLHECVRMAKADLPPTEVGFAGFKARLHICVGPAAADRPLLRSYYCSSVCCRLRLSLHVLGGFVS